MKRGKVLVSVVMSVYNDEQYLKESLDSIFAQTIQNFELIIVDDCSTDRTVEIIENYHDDRIRLIRNTENRGLTRNLNTALEYVQGTYIARMDGDDKSRPERFEKQIAYLEQHPDLMLISCRTHMFGEEDLISQIQGTPKQLQAMMLIRPVLAHPGFMMRRELISFVRGENLPMIHSINKIGMESIRNPMTVIATMIRRIIIKSSFC